MRQPLSRLASVASAAVILAVGLAPLGVQAADHLNSPTVTGSGATDLTDVSPSRSCLRTSATCIA